MSQKFEKPKHHSLLLVRLKENICLLSMKRDQSSKDTSSINFLTPPSAKPPPPHPTPLTQTSNRSRSLLAVHE